MSEILSRVSNYYTGKVKEHGFDSKGVDWNSKESQFLRFDKLSEAFLGNHSFSLLDYGCGTGTLVEYLESKENDFNYHGYDISEEMTRLAASKFISPKVTFSNTLPDRKFDYVVASGLFNVKLQFDTKDWQNYILETLDSFNEISEKGFAFNVLTSYSDKEKQRADLYYADPLELFDLCKRKYSRFVSLVHDYPLYEFTIIVRKNI